MEPAPLVPTWDTIKMFSELRQILFLEFQKNVKKFSDFFVEKRKRYVCEIYQKRRKNTSPPSEI